MKETKDRIEEAAEKHAQSFEPNDHIYSDAEIAQMRLWAKKDFKAGATFLADVLDETIVIRDAYGDRVLKQTEKIADLTRQLSASDELARDATFVAANLRAEVNNLKSSLRSSERETSHLADACAALGDTLTQKERELMGKMAEALRVRDDSSVGRERVNNLLTSYNSLKRNSS